MSDNQINNIYLVSQHCWELSIIRTKKFIVASKSLTSCEKNFTEMLRIINIYILIIKYVNNNLKIIIFLVLYSYMNNFKIKDSNYF